MQNLQFLCGRDQQATKMVSIIEITDRVLQIPQGMQLSGLLQEIQDIGVCDLVLLEIQDFQILQKGNKVEFLEFIVRNI